MGTNLALASPYTSLRIGYVNIWGFAINGHRELSLIILHFIILSVTAVPGRETMAIVLLLNLKTGHLLTSLVPKTAPGTFPIPKCC